MVVARDGQPVTDLKPEEVTLRIDGKIRPIKTLQFVRDVRPASAARAPRRRRRVRRRAGVCHAIAATAADAPRSIVLVVDDESMPIGQEQKLRSALNNFVQDLPPTDQVALVTVPHGGLKVGFTADRDRLRTRDREHQSDHADHAAVVPDAHDVVDARDDARPARPVQRISP